MARTCLIYLYIPDTFPGTHRALYECISRNGRKEGEKERKSKREAQTEGEKMKRKREEFSLLSGNL